MLPDEVSGSLDSSDPQFRNLVFTSIFRLIIRIQIVRDLYGNNLINESNIKISSLAYTLAIWIL